MVNSVLRVKSDYICCCDKLPCNRFNSELDGGDCVHFDAKGRLTFLCKRYISPFGFSVPKQLSPEELESGDFSLRSV